MTLIEAIHRTDAVKPNGYSQDEKIRWISVLDGTVKSEIIDPREGAEDVSFRPYDENTPLTQILLIPHPYDDIYIRWLEAQMDYANGEIGRYNNSITSFNAALAAFERCYHRLHRVRGGGFVHF